MAPCPISRSPSHYRGEDYTVEKTEGRTEPKEKKLETTVSVSAVHEDDDEALDDEKPQLVKQFSFISSLGMALIILNSWIMATMTLNVGITQGGPVVVLWGELVAGIGQTSIALCLSELCSLWPTPKGQYGWAYLTATMGSEDPKVKRRASLISYYCGWLTWTGWCIMFSGTASVTTNMTFYLVSLWNPDYVLEPWHFFLVYVLCLTISLTINTFASRTLHAFDAIGVFWISIGGLVLILVTLAVAGSKSGSEPKFQSSTFVFTTFINNSGWNDFVLIMTGMVQPTFTITCFDAVAHVIDEMPNPRKDAPRCITMAVVFGTITTFIVVVALMFCITDIEAVTTSTAGPLVTILYQATRSRVGATCLTLIPYIGILIGAQATLTTASRVTLSLAEDDAVAFSSFFSKVNKRLNAPIPALIVPWVFSVIIGLLYLGSSAMFSSILSTTLVALGISYLIPIITVALKGRHCLRSLKPQWSLGKPFGAVCYTIAIGWGCLTAVMFCFPATPSVDGSTLNYTAPVIGVAMGLATVNWFAYSRKVYVGPKLDGVWDDAPSMASSAEGEKNTV